MPWYVYILEFIAGALLANGVPHFVKGVSGSPFQSPFASPPGVGESPPLANALWGYANLAAGFVLIWFFGPRGPAAFSGWVAVAAGALAMAAFLSRHFGKVRAERRQNDHGRF